MSNEVIVPGRYVDHTFIPEGPLPDAEGQAELRIRPRPSLSPVSVFSLFGKAKRLRTANEIAAQINEDRNDWGEP
ncbi:MAG: hypothetical protein HYX68_02760 [Planctomycetes bacterium]|jgi:hypothetical protein|nr:hypothetical protein [Planctomycetota bacterium]